MVQSQASGAGRPARSELGRALGAFKSAFWGAGALSAVLNILTLSGSFFMLLVYDSVLPSRSGATLLGLVVLVTVLYAFQAALEVLRSRIMVQVGAAVDVALSPRIYDLVSRLTLSGRTAEDGLQPLRDLDQLRGFLSGPGLLAFFDLPWIVLYLGICFAFHVAIGLVALAGALVLIGLTLLNDRLTREAVRHAAATASLRNGMAETNRQNIEVLTALGMRRRLEAAWRRVNHDHLRSQQRVSDIGGGLSSITRVLRLLLQSLVLAMGAWLVLQNKATGGVIITSSILTSRALAPIEMALANWRGFIAARQSWARLNQLMAKLPASEPPTPLPAPSKVLAVETLSLAPPGAQRLSVQDVAFSLKAGDGLGIVGPSASGKSSLARGLVGVWPAVRGKVRLDGAALDQWDDERLGRHIGYLPQDVELLSGSIAENIGRFDPEADPEAVISAAMKAHAHELILRLPEGYETRLGPKGQGLSAGQAQRVALARALYGDPFLIVLDEPDSNLDAEGEKALGEAVAEARSRGAIVVVVAHRPSALAAVDQVLLMHQGRQVELGDKDKVLPKLLPRAPLRAVETGERGLMTLTTTPATTLPYDPQAAIKRTLRLALIVLVLLIVGAGGLAATTRVNGAVIAQGQVVVASDVKKVQHPTGGVVADIRVKDGAHVRAGDVLLELDPTVASADASIIGGSVDSLAARQARLEAERDSRPIRWPADLQARRKDPAVAAAIKDETRLFQLRITARQGQESQLKERVDQLKQEIDGFAGQAKAKQQEIALVQQELTGVRKLYAQNLVTLDRLNSLERAQVELNSDVAQLQSQTAEARGKIAEIQLQIIQLGQDARTDAGNQLNDVETRLSDLRQRKVAADDQFKRITIRSPQDGVVDKLSVHAPGAVIAPGAEILDIVPDKDRLEVEAKIRTSDVDKVKAAQTAMLRFSAFNVRTTPELKGEVEHVSADAHSDDRTGASYFLVRVGIPPAEVARLGAQKLEPGMPVECFIQTEPRSMLSYVLKPMTDQFRRAFREE